MKTKGVLVKALFASKLHFICKVWFQSFINVIYLFMYVFIIIRKFINSE